MIADKSSTGRADRPNQKWLADFTYIWTAEGWLYVAVELDLLSRRAVEEARADVFDHIERFCNPRRRHSKLGYLSLTKFEAQAMPA